MKHGESKLLKVADLETASWAELFKNSKPITREDAIRRMNELAKASREQKES